LRVRLWVGQTIKTLRLEGEKGEVKKERLGWGKGGEREPRQALQASIKSLISKLKYFGENAHNMAPRTR